MTAHQHFRHFDSTALVGVDLFVHTKSGFSHSPNRLLHYASLPYLDALDVAMRDTTYFATLIIAEIVPVHRFVNDWKQFETAKTLQSVRS